MSVLRQLNALGQMRVDVPHLRSIESSVAGDFDVVVGRGIAGDRALVVRGFTLTNVSVGTAAHEIQLITADSIVYNINASESGSFLWVPSDRALEQLSSANAKVSGSFTASAVNYVGIDFKRTADDSTTDLAQFLDANTKLESGRNIPLGRTLDYVILISTAPFSASPNITPIAKVTTDASNKVASVQDARPMLFRLASGGDFPNTQSSYAWPFGRQETAVTDKFTGGDKNILSNKDWMDAVVSRLWDLGGGENWYSPTHPKNIRMIRAAAPNVFSNGENWETIGTHTHWRGLSLVFENANNTGVYYNEIKDQLTDDTVNFQTQLAVGDCLYVDVDFTQNRTGVNALVMKKAPLQSLGTPTVPGSRLVIAWRSQNAGSVDVYTRDYPYLSNVTILPATTTSVGGVRLNETAATGATPTVVTIGVNNQVHVGQAPYGIVGANPAIVAVGGAGAAGIQSTGGANGIGMQGIGGADNANGVVGLGTGTGTGVFGTGGATNGIGVQGQGTGTGFGGYFTGGGVGFGGHGVVGIGGAFEGYGGRFTGSAGGKGVFAESGVGSNEVGVDGYGDGLGAGVQGSGGGTSGPGVYGLGGAPNGRGVEGKGTGTGTGVVGLSSASTASSVTNNAGGYFKGTGVGVHAVGDNTLAGFFSTTVASNATTAEFQSYGTGVSIDAFDGSGNTSKVLIRATGYYGVNGLNPVGTTSFSNTITPKNICKAWANITFNNTVNPAIADSFNITSITQSTTGAATFVLTITFAGDFTDTNYGVWITFNRKLYTTNWSKNLGTMTLEVWDDGGQALSSSLSTFPAAQMNIMFMGAN